MKKKNILTILAIIVILILGPTFLLRKIRTSKAAWFNDSWGYRTAITITNSGSSVTNQKVKLDIDTATLYSAGKIQINCNDSRFTDANGKLLQYYLDSTNGACNTSSTDYYVLMPTINAGSTTIYHYYGNPSATKGSQLSQLSQSTWRAYDSFDTTTLSTDWTWLLGTGVGVTGALRAATLTADGYNMITNPEFTTDTTGWTAFRTISKESALALGISPSGGLDDGILKVLNTGGVNGYARQTRTGLIGAKYTLSCRAYAPSANTGVNDSYMQGGVGLNYKATWGSAEDVWQTLSFTEVATGTVCDVNLVTLGPADDIVYWDAVWEQINLALAWHSNFRNIDGTFTAGIPFPASGTTPRSLAFRITDALNYWEVRVLPNTAGTDTYIIEHVAGVQTTRASADVDWTSNATDEIQVVLSGDDITVNHKKSGASSWTQAATYGTMATGLTSTKHGVLLYATGADQYTYWEAAGASNSVATASEEQSKGPIAYWAMDDPVPAGTGQEVRDSSSNRNNGTFGIGSSAPSWQTEDMCVSGKCLKFDGNDFVSIGSTAKSVQTVSFWVKPTTTSQNFLDLDGGTHYISATSGVVSATGFTSPTIYVNGKNNGTLTANNWNHIEVTTATSFTATSIKLGRRTTNYLTGFMDEVKLYQYARSTAEIKADYNARGTQKGVSFRTGSGIYIDSSSGAGMTSGLVGYWKMDENTGTTTADSSGNGNTGTLGTGDSAPGWVAGMYGVGLSFDGSNDQVQLSSTTNIPKAGSFTVSTWVKPGTGNTTNYNKVVGWNYDDSWGLGIKSNTLLIAMYDHGGTLVRRQTTSGSVTSDVWNNLVVTYDQSTKILKAYIGGVLNSQWSNVESTDTSYSQFYFGRHSSAASPGYFTGSLDEIRIYNRALSPAEVRNLYNWAPGPKVYLKTDEGVGSSAFDSSGYSNNGLLNGGSWSTGKYGKGVKLNGSTDNISINDFNY